MAVPTGSGTETIHAHHFEECDNEVTMILGLQHHTYTVLSIIVYCVALDATTDEGWIFVEAYDIHGGAASQNINIAKFNIQVGETYVWNDKFSFFGHGPGGSAGMTDANQLLLAAQAGVQQKLMFDMTSSDDGGQDYDIHCTYLDQDWS